MSAPVLIPPLGDPRPQPELAGELAARLAAVSPEQVQTAARGLDPGTVAVLELRATGGRR